MENITTIIPELREMAVKASANAYSPYSNALVGCALLTENGKMYSGCNIENSSYGATICAERVAIVKAMSEKPISSGCRKIAVLYVYSKDGWPPCGMCRQVMSEFASHELKIIIGDQDQNEKIYNFTEIFPLAFTPEHLSK